MNVVYCIGCKSHIYSKDAKLVMKTGFYKSMSLAVCLCCSDRIPL